MKKTKFIAIVLVVAVMLMGAGYAAWNETVTINNTVATGELKVEFVKACAKPYISAWDNYNGSDYDDHYMSNVNIYHGPQTTTLTVDDMYPGSKFRYEAKVENLGTIPAKIESIDVTFVRDSEILRNNLIVHGMIMHKRPGQSGPVTIATYELPCPGITLNNLQAKLREIIPSDFELLKGDFFTFDTTEEYRNELAQYIDGYDPTSEGCLFFRIPMSAGNEVENQEIEFDISFTFKQFNQ